MNRFLFKNLSRTNEKFQEEKKGVVTCSLLPTTENHMFPPLFKSQTGKLHTLAPTETRTPPIIPESVQKPANMRRQVQSALSQQARGLIHSAEPVP